MPFLFSALADAGRSASLSPSKEEENISITFNDLRYFVRVSRSEEKAVLRGVSGCLEARRMTALMGPSGSGKTTLMDILAGRKSGAGRIEGEVLYKGNQVPKPALRYLAGYVEQFDALVEELTVEQMLMYTADLKLPRSVSRERRRRRVEDVIEKLRLDGCRNTVIGNVLSKGISGGQAKRTNVAMALITRPQVLFLDEPTTGLDSKMAGEVCEILKSLVQDGCTVVATIHSPSPYAFSLFDDLLILQAGGQMMYGGSLADARPHFETLGKAYEPGVSNLADWLADAASGIKESCPEEVDFDATWSIASASTVEARTSSKLFADAWEGSEAGATYRRRCREVREAAKARPFNVKKIPHSGPGELLALWTLITYRGSAHLRSGGWLAPRIGDKVYIALLSVSLYWGIGDDDDASGMLSTSSMMFFYCCLCGFGAGVVAPSLTLDRALFYRERADGCYSSITYFFSKVIEEAMITVITSLAFSCIVFFPIRLQGSFLIFFATHFITTMLSVVMAVAISSISPDLPIAQALTTFYVTTCIFFGGFFLLFDKIPPWWKWYSWTAFVRYTWGAMMLNQFADSADGDSEFFYDEESGRYVTLLEFYGMGPDEPIMSSVLFCLGMLGCLFFFFALLGALGLTFISHARR